MPPDFDLTRDGCHGLLIDVQERFVPAIPALDERAGAAPALAGMTLLLRGLALLGVPLAVSEQYKKGLGETLPALRDAAGAAASYHEKTAFSCLDDAGVRDHLAASEREVLLIAGIEAHICVLATVADALRHGYAVVVATDAVASRQEAHRDHALAAMRDLGALVLPSESILFRLQRLAGVGQFKALSQLVR